MSLQPVLTEVFVSERGVRKRQRAVEWGDATILSPQRPMAMASLLDEDYLDGEIVDLGSLKTFLAGLDSPPWFFRYSTLAHLGACAGGGTFDVDNRSCLRVEDPDYWGKKVVAKDVRESLRRIRREGVEVREMPFNASSCEDISTLFNESPIRQGKRYWHYGKSAAQIQEELSPLASRSLYVGAYHRGRLVGFTQVVRLESIGVLRTVHVLGSLVSRKVRPVTAMIDWMVRYGWENGFQRIVYGKHDYGNASNDSLTAFKSRHGFRSEPLRIDYHCLCPQGAWYLAAGLHRNLREMTPRHLALFLKKARSRLISAK